MENKMDGHQESEMLPVLRFDHDPAVANVECTEEIACLKCEKFYKFPDDKDQYLAHLFLEHRLIIADVEDIAILEEYLKFWQKEFKDHEFEEYCTTMLLDQLPDGTTAKNEKYYLLCDILYKDYELRKSLQEKRLQNALERHQFERTDRNFSKECLYCRDVITGSRADFLEHLFSKHFLQLGRPENLVFVDELLAKVQHNLDQLVCLYCEKVFKDRVTLKDHMRKKIHKRINPSNRAYDKYFLVNYRQERPKQVTKDTNKHREGHAQKKSYNNAAATAAKSDASDTATKCKFNTSDYGANFDRHFGHGNSDDSDWSDWDGEQMPSLNCLYCSHKETVYADIKAHMLEQHTVDFGAAVKDLNFYHRVKMVNYVRRQICLLRCVTCNRRCDTIELLMEHMTVEEHFGLGTRKQWDKPEFFFPTYEDDGLLCVLDDNPNEVNDDTMVNIISEEPKARINKDAERLSLENFKFM